MSKSSYTLAQKTSYRVTLDIIASKELDLNSMKWHKLLDLQTGESVNVEVNVYNSFIPDKKSHVYIATLHIVALEDLDPHQINWKRIISEKIGKNFILDFKSYVEVLDAPYSW